MSYVIHVMVKPGNILIEYMQILSLNRVMYDLVYALMDLIHIFKHLPGLILVGAVTRTKHVDKLTYHGSSNHSSEEIVQLKQEVLNYTENNERLSQQLQQQQQQFQSFISVVLPFLSPDAQTTLQQQQQQEQ